jgi:hypothetical protein
MVMSRDALGNMARDIGGQRYADPIHHPFGPVAQPGDPNAALIAAIQALSAQFAAWVPGNGNGSGSVSGLCVPGPVQAVQFLTVPLTTALVKYEITIPGCYDYCVAFTDGSTEGITIRQVTHDAAPIDLGRYTGFPLIPSTTKLFVTANVLPGRTVLVLGLTIGKELHLASQRQIVTQSIYAAAIVAAGTFYTTWFNYTNGRLLVDVVSTLDAACTLQLVGNIAQDFTTAKNIGAPLNCPATGINPAGLDIGLDLDDWHPYIGVVIVTPLAPTAGILTIKTLQLAEGDR